MREFRGGLLASAATAAALGFVDPMLCSIEGEGGEGAGGGASGAAALLEDPPAGGTGEGDKGGQGAEGTGTGEEPPVVADWMKTFSGEKVGEDISNQEWLAKAGVKDLDGLAKIARDNQKALRESGRIKIPGDNATDEERAAFREAIGAPKEASGYEIVMPEGSEEFEVDAAVIDPLKEIAHKHGIPKVAFKELADVFLQAQLEDAKEEVARTDREAAEHRKGWGAESGQKTEEFRRGANWLGLTAPDVQAIQREFGAGKTLDLFAKIGRAMGEDFFKEGNPAQRFGVASTEAAQAAVDRFVNDKELVAKLNAKDPATVQSYNRAVEALAEWRSHDSKKKRG